jgi:hypothetical protein
VVKHGDYHCCEPVGDQEVKHFNDLWENLFNEHVVRQVVGNEVNQVGDIIVKQIGDTIQ